MKKKVTVNVVLETRNKGGRVETWGKGEVWLNLYMTTLHVSDQRLETEETTLILVMKISHTQIDFRSEWFRDITSKHYDDSHLV